MCADQIKEHLYDGAEEIFPCIGEPVQIPGPCGPLEAVASCPEEVERNVVAVICHPHPLYGGSLKNKVVHYIAKTLSDLGVHTVRFNFRGVGESAGHYDEGVGEVDDLMAVIEWSRNRLPGYDLVLAGFSFGAYIAMQAASKVELKQLITVAPAVNFFDVSSIEQPDCPWLLIQGDEDEIVPYEDVLQFASRFTRIEPVTLNKAGHFFHGRLNDLQAVIRQHVHFS